MKKSAPIVTIQELFIDKLMQLIESVCALYDVIIFPEVNS